MTNPPTDPVLTGPYDGPNNGYCAYGHPANGSGRCAQINATPPNCPTRAERIALLLTMPVDDVRAIAINAGVPNMNVPPLSLLSGAALRTALAPLIATAEGLL